MTYSSRALGVLCAAFAFTQVTAQIRDQSEAATTARRIAELNREFEGLQKLTPAEKQLVEVCKTNCSNASREVREGSAAAATERATRMDRVTADIHQTVDSYVTRTVSPVDLDHKAVQERLRQILGSAAYDTPRAFTLDAGRDRRLVIVYTLQKGTLMGPGATSVTVRAYASQKGRFALAGIAGDDMDGYGGLKVVALDSPIPGELWLLMWGQMTGANGPNIRMRIYAYDRTRFRPVWMPENAWGAFTVSTKAQGFTVDGPYYHEERVRHDSYSLARDGLYRKAR